MKTTADKLRIMQWPARQDSLRDQLRDLRVLADRVGMHDAADWLWKAGHLDRKEGEPYRGYVRPATEEE